MGISCDFEAGSMESEIKPTYNKEFIKLDGPHDLEATPATSTPHDAITIDVSKSADVIIDLASPEVRFKTTTTTTTIAQKAC